MTRPMDPLQRAVRVALPVGVAYAAIAVFLGHAHAGRAGGLGALVGALLPLVFFGITAVTGMWARRLNAQALGFAVLGSWLPKMLVLLVFLHWMKQGTWYDKPTFFVTLLAGTVLLLGTEGWIVTHAPQLYVDGDGK